jgi:hypothetical protein
MEELWVTGRAERSADTALDSSRPTRTGHRLTQSGMALRFPPHSKEISKTIRFPGFVV